MNSKYDIVIIGSGFGGLLTGNILSKKGFKVAIIEKNDHHGGCLQSFKVGDVIFDTGIHYVGGLKKGQTINRILGYLGILHDLNLREMDADGFDHFLIGNKEYVYPSGYSSFQSKLESYFPEESQGIQKYIGKIQSIANSISLYNLRPTQFSLENFYAKYGYGNLWEFIQSITKNTELQQLLAAQNPLYAGTPESTFLFVHALITNHYLEGPYRFVDGSKQLADALVNKFKSYGGEIFYNERASKFKFSGDSIACLQTANGQEYSGSKYISSIHPYFLMEMIDPDKIRKSYRNRLQNLKNTSSMFNLYLELKDGTVPYLNYNYYYYPSGDVWALSYYDREKFPQTLNIFPIADSVDEKYTRGLSVLAFMDYEDVSRWEDSKLNQRGEEYEAFKEEKSNKVIDMLEIIYPGIRKNIKSYVTATPLTFRDYTGTYRGAIYGIDRDYRYPNTSLIFPKTKLPNLYITGQNLSLHGMLGVSMGALLTCAEFIHINELIEEFNND
jgi:all-trans-retinol 13,14-reductase